jgi:hypothetical protein
MRWPVFLLLLLTSFACRAGEPSIIKVLPHFLDSKGREALYPSLFERDAYQLELRTHPERIQAIRFDIQWKCTDHAGPLTMRLEVRGAKMGLGDVKVFETTVKPRKFFSKWSPLRIDKKTYEQIGEIVAWRATLWDGPKKIAEQESFLF